MIIDSIVVIYNPDERLVLDNITMISSNTDRCYVIVNSCDPLLLEKIAQINSVVIIDNKANIGLSKSLNIGLKQVMKNGADGVILFDQDSLPAPDFFTSIMACYQDLINTKESVGAIGGKMTDAKHAFQGSISTTTASEIDVIITSGCFIPISTLQKVGLMDETFFIDYIDYEWCFRAKSMGYKIFVSNQSILHHNLGDNLVGLAGIKKPIHNNVMRHYHIIKNQLIMMCRNYVPLQWRIVHFFKIFYRIPGYILYSSQRKKTTKNIVSAIVDFAKMKDKKKYTY